MAENYREDLFKTAKRGGYDREDVEHRFQIIKEAAAIEKNQLQDQIYVKDQEIAGLNDKIREHKEEIESLKKDISEKYQSYKDNYDMIGQLIFDSKIQAKKIVDDAIAEKERILGEVDAEVSKIREEARSSALDDAMKEKEELELKILEKMEEYDAICAKIAALLAKLDGVQGMVEDSVKAIHAIAEEEKIPLEPEKEESLDDPDEEELEIPEPASEEEAFDIDDTHEIEFEKLHNDEYDDSADE